MWRPLLVRVPSRLLNSSPLFVNGLLHHSFSRSFASSSADDAKLGVETLRTLGSSKDPLLGAQNLLEALSAGRFSPVLMTVQRLLVESLPKKTTDSLKSMSSFSSSAQSLGAGKGLPAALAVGAEAFINAILRSSAHRHEFAGCSASWELLRSWNLRPDAAAADAWLSALVSEGRSSEALVIFESLCKPPGREGASLSPSETTLAILIRAASMVDEWRRVEVIWARLTTGSPPAISPVKPGREAFNAYAIAAARAGLRRAALQVLDRMRRSGLQPDKRTFIAVILAAAYTGRLALAQSIYSEAVESIKLVAMPSTSKDGAGIKQGLTTTTTTSTTTKLASPASRKSDAMQSLRATLLYAAACHGSTALATELWLEAKSVSVLAEEKGGASSAPEGRGASIMSCFPALFAAAERANDLPSAVAWLAEWRSRIARKGSQTGGNLAAQHAEAASVVGKESSLASQSVVENKYSAAAAATPSSAEYSASSLAPYEGVLDRSFHLLQNPPLLPESSPIPYETVIRVASTQALQVAAAFKDTEGGGASDPNELVSVALDAWEACKADGGTTHVSIKSAICLILLHCMSGNISRAVELIDECVLEKGLPHDARFYIPIIRCCSLLSEVDSLQQSEATSTLTVPAAAAAAAALLSPPKQDEGGDRRGAKPRKKLGKKALLEAAKKREADEVAQTTTSSTPTPLASRNTTKPTGSLDIAEVVLQRYLDAGLAPSPSLYRSLAAAARDAKDAIAAERYLQASLSSGLTPDILLFELALTTAVAVDRPDIAARVASAMSEAGLEPSKGIIEALSTAVQREKYKQGDTASVSATAAASIRQSHQEMRANAANDLAWILASLDSEDSSRVATFEVGAPPTHRLDSMNPLAHLLKEYDEKYHSIAQLEMDLLSPGNAASSASSRSDGEGDEYDEEGYYAMEDGGEARLSDAAASRRGGDFESREGEDEDEGGDLEKPRLLPSERIVASSREHAERQVSPSARMGRPRSWIDNSHSGGFACFPSMPRGGLAPPRRIVSDGISVAIPRDMLSKTLEEQRLAGIAGIAPVSGALEEEEETHEAYSGMRKLQQEIARRPGSVVLRRRRSPRSVGSRRHSPLDAGADAGDDDDDTYDDAAGKSQFETAIVLRSESEAFQIIDGSHSSASLRRASAPRSGAVGFQDSADDDAISSDETLPPPSSLSATSARDLHSMKRKAYARAIANRVSNYTAQ